MQITMEILSQMVPRTDSGAGPRHKTQSFSSQGVDFGKILDEKRADNPYRQQTETEQPGRTGNEGRSARQEPKKPEIDDSGGDWLAIGATGNQSMVVIILEGDKESAAIPDITIEAARDPGLPLPEAAQGAETGPIVEAPVEAEPDENEPAEQHEPLPDARDEADAAYVPAVEGNPAPVRERRAESKAGPEPLKADAADKLNGEKGEATARTPAIRTSEEQESGESARRGPEYTEKGDLGPLENENDDGNAQPQAKEQKGRAYAGTADAVRSKAQSAPAASGSGTPPLTEGIKTERFHAEQQMMQTALSEPVAKESLFDEMVARIETLQTESKTEMSIQLKPEFLGKVALEIAMDAAGLHVRINAEDGGVRSMINSQMAALIESLENKGVAVADVEVAYTGIDNGTFRDSREDQPRQDRQRRHIREIDSSDITEYYAAMPLEALEYFLDEEVSSVEYRA